MSTLFTLVTKLTQIRISDEIKSELDLQGRKGESYNAIIQRNITFVKKFSNEEQFSKWFVENYNLIGFSKIYKQNPSSFPDFIMIKDEKKVRVELETASSNFIKHGHDASEVDLVICLVRDIDLPVEILEINMFQFKTPKKSSVQLSNKTLALLNECQAMEAQRRGESWMKHDDFLKFACTLYLKNIERDECKTVLYLAIKEEIQ